MFQFVKINLKKFVTERKGRGAADTAPTTFTGNLFLVAALFLFAFFAAFVLTFFAAFGFAAFCTLFAALGAFLAALGFLTLAAFVHAALCFALLVGAAFAVFLCASGVLACASGMFALVVANLLGLLGGLFLSGLSVLVAVASYHSEYESGSDDSGQ